jgi:tetratricopeptide (TPR) repeat protein
MTMRDLWDDGILLRILLLGVLIALLGLSPLPKAITTSFEMARRAQSVPNPGAVANNLAVVAEQQPWRSGLWEAAGHAALAAGNPQSAGVYFAQAAAKGELSVDGYLAWGDAEWQNSNAFTALQIWEIAERGGIPEAQILPRQAQVYRTLGDDLVLIETLKALLAQPNATVSDPEVRGSLYHELGLLLAAYDPAAAPAYLMQAAELNPDLEPQIRDLNFAIQQELSKNDPVYLLVVAGRALANQGNWALAENAFENAVDLNPEYAESWAYLGEARQHVNSGADPLTALEMALELAPESLAANTFLSLYWHRQEDHDQALLYLQKAAELDPDNPALLVEIGNLSALLGDLETGQDYYHQAMTLRTSEPQYVREFLKFCLRYNLDLQEVALPLARQLVIFNPDDPASLDVMGEVLMRLGDLLDAERFFLRALEHDPTYDQAHLHLGNLYRLQSEPELARYHYGQVLELTTNAQTRMRAQEALDEYLSH